MQLHSVLNLIVDCQNQHSVTFKNFAIQRKSRDMNALLSSVQFSY